MCSNLLIGSTVGQAEIVRALRVRVAELEAERDNWENSAAQFVRNADFYQDIVVQIGEHFGALAKTSDDGTVQQDVLALKVPELVEALKAERDRLREALEEIAGHTTYSANVAIRMMNLARKALGEEVKP